MARAKASAAEWAARVRAWRASGEPAGTYAARRGWSSRTLTWWASQLRDTARTEPAAPGGFVQLVQRHEPERVAGPRGGGTGAIEVILERGRSIRVAPDADLELLRAVVEALEER